jgi:hypothetical protein
MTDNGVIEVEGEVVVEEDLLEKMAQALDIRITVGAGGGVVDTEEVPTTNFPTPVHNLQQRPLLSSPLRRSCSPRQNQGVARMLAGKTMKMKMRRCASFAPHPLNTMLSLHATIAPVISVP